MLPPGLYEQVINTALNREISEIPAARKSVAPIDKAEACNVLAQYLADVIKGPGECGGQRRESLHTDWFCQPNRRPHSEHHPGS